MDESPKLIFSFMIKGVQPVMTNDMYIPTKGKNKGAYFRKSPMLQRFQVEFEDNMRMNYGNELLEDISKQIHEVIETEDNLFNFSVTVAAPKNSLLYKKDDHTLKAMDTSNFIKAIEDSFCKLMNYDDRNHLKVTSRKIVNKEDEWYIFIYLEECDRSDLFMS